MTDGSLITKISARLAAGEQEEAIRTDLIAQGFSPEDVNGAFAMVKLQNSPARTVSASAQKVVPLHKANNKLIFNILIIVLFVSAAPAAYGFYTDVIAPSFAASFSHATSTPSGTDDARNPFALTYIPEGTGQPASKKSVGQSVSSFFVGGGQSAPSPAPSPTPTTQPPVQTPPINPSVPPVVVTPPSYVPPVVTPPATTPPPAPVSPPVIVPPAPSGNYQVYAGCQTPATTYANTIYVDPAAGSDTGDGTQANPYKTLGTVLAQNKLQTDTHVILLPGDHGVIRSDNYTNVALSNATSGWVWLDFRPGATAQFVLLTEMHRWLITGAEVTNAPLGRTLLLVFGSTDMVIADSNVYGAADSSGWDAARWIAASDGITSDDSKCVSMLRNRITNVHFALSMSIRSGSSDPTKNSIKGLAQDNVIRNFSGDGMRPIGSDITFYHNGIYDEYVSAADGDDNHDDGIQGFALNGAVYNNLVIDHNWVQESTDPNRRFNAVMQGISSFDGVYENVRVTNNVVLASAFHGIAWYGARDSLIDHNTVVNPTHNGNTLWIYVAAEGSVMPSNVTVSNNTAELFISAPTGVTFTNNATTTDPTAAFTTFDPVGNNFNFTPKPGGILDGLDVGAVNTRPIAMAQRAEGSTQLAAVQPRSQLASALSAYSDFVQQTLAAVFDFLVQLFSGLRF